MESLSELEGYALQLGSFTTKYNSRERLFAEGETAKGIYYVADDHVKILKHHQKSTDVFLWYAGPKELIGLTSFFHGEETHAYSAIAGERGCKAIFFSNDTFAELIKHYPALKPRLLSMLCKRIRFMEMRMNNMLYQSIDERLMETLLFFAERENGQETGKRQKSLPINYTIKEIAEMVGTSLSCLKRRIRALKGQELINFDGNRLLINDVDKLKCMLHDSSNCCS